MNKYKITTPCTQDWNAMLRVDGGRFCEHCNKTVHDLTDGKDIIPSTTNETFCGRIIDETPVIPKKISFSRLIFWQRIVRLSPVLASLLLGKTALGQTKDTILYEKSPIDISSHEQEIKGKIIISGIIRDKGTLEGLPFAKVIVSANDSIIGQVETDFDGKFRIMFDTSEIKSKNYDIKMAYNGYEGKLIKDIPKIKNDIVIDLRMALCDSNREYSCMVGGVVAEYYDEGPPLDFSKRIPIPIDSRPPVPDGIYINSPDLKKKQK